MPLSTKKKPTKKTARRSHHTTARASASTTAFKPDAVSLLRADHKTMRNLLTELKSAGRPTQRERLLAQVKRELEAHTKIEEEIFYPAFRARAQNAEDQQLFHEAMAEHNAADLMLREVESADSGSEEFPGRAKVLKEVVEHHAGEEETEMFPRVRELFTASELRALGEEMAERKRNLLRRVRTSSTLEKVANFVSAPFSGSAKPAAESRA